MIRRDLPMPASLSISVTPPWPPRGAALAAVRQQRLLGYSAHQFDASFFDLSLG
jgi:hypothetical protein